MNPESIDNVREGFRSLAPRGPELFEAFVGRITDASPSMRGFFPEQPREHAQEYLSSFGMVIKNLHRLGAIEYLLTDLGEKNVARGIEPRHYGLARDCLLEVLSEALQGGWTDQVRADWTEAIQTVTSLMIRGAGRSRRRAA